jgi:hypothetical protein
MPYRSVLIAILVLLLVSCHGYRAPQFDPALYPRTYQQFDLTLNWRIERSATACTIEGFARNTRFTTMHGLEITGTLLDESGKKLSESTFYFFPGQLDMDDIAPFTINLPLPQGVTPAKLRLFYRYRAGEGSDSDRTPWFQSFEVEPR